MFCDVIMPGLTGVDFVIELEKDDVNARIVLMSGGGMFEPGDVLEGLRNHAVDQSASEPCELQESLDALDACPVLTTDQLRRPSDQ